MPEGFVGPGSAELALLTLPGWASEIGVPPRMVRFKLGVDMFRYGPTARAIGVAS